MSRSRVVASASTQAARRPMMFGAVGKAIGRELRVVLRLSDVVAVGVGASTTRAFARVEVVVVVVVVVGTS